MSFRLCFLKLIIFCLASFWPNFIDFACAAETCGDDPRLRDLSTILQNGEPPNHPLTMLPETFIRLHPVARAVLGRAVIICPGTPLNVEGRPLLRPIKVQFPDLWEKIEACIGRGDWAEIAYLRDNFAPAPLPSEAVFSLLVLPPYSESNMKQLAESLGIKTFSDRRRNKVSRFFVADVFSALGGRVMEGSRMGVAASVKELTQLRTKAEALGRNEIFVLFSGDLHEQAIRSLKNSGVDAVPGSAIF